MNGYAHCIFDAPDGVIFDLEPSYDGKKLLMSYRETEYTPFHLWEINTDGSGLKQLTSGPYHDFNPTYYPDGRIVFCSSRCESYAMCQDYLACSLYTCNENGNNIQRIDFTTLCSNEPSILPDGRIIFSRWEYQDKSIYTWHGIWTIFPDGQNLRLYYGNTFTVPNVMYGPKPIPNSNNILITMAAHHYPPIGDIAIIDRQFGAENIKGIEQVTHNTRYLIKTGHTWHDSHWNAGGDFYPQTYTDPWPVGNNSCLVSYGGPTSTSDHDQFKICLLSYAGHITEIYSSTKNSYYSPVTLNRRPSPHIIPDTLENPEADTGTFYIQDIYQGLLEQEVERGEVTHLRIMEQLPKPVNGSGPRIHDQYPIIGWGTNYVKYNHGTVPVQTNGSACFNAPANRELYFIALNKEGKEIRRMGSVTQIRGSQFVSCTGCHDNRDMTPFNSMIPMKSALNSPDQITPPTWGAGPVDYVSQVQPVFDQYCVRCHNGPKPDGGVNLSGDRTRFFNMSYSYLIHNDLVDYFYLVTGPTGVFPGKKTGSYISALNKYLEGRHENIIVDEQGRRAIYAWIDANIPYYATYYYSRPGTLSGRDTWADEALKPLPWLRDSMPSIIQGGERLELELQAILTGVEGFERNYSAINLSHLEWSLWPISKKPNIPIAPLSPNNVEWMPNVDQWGEVFK